MWSAQFVSNIGSWMQTVAAQWLMLTLTGSAAYVALVQTAAGLPVVLFAIVAGTVGDLVDRRRFLLATQTFMLVAATALGALAIAGLVTPWVLLALVFAVGTGQALTSPTWQTLQPELVSPAERVQAISLGSVNQNLARAIGPAIGGALLAATSSGTVFLVNAASFAAVLAVLMAWHSTRAPDALPREHVGEAIRAGGRYITASPVLRVILARAGLFIVFASAIWALLPLTAQSALHLGAGGYGLLLGSVGIGAVAGAALLPRLRARLSPDALLAAGSIGLAAVTLLLAYAHVTAVAAVALVVGGACWILGALSTVAPEIAERAGLSSDPEPSPVLRERVLGVRRRFLGRPPPPARARDQARTGASGARPRADRPGPPRHRHPLAGRQLAQTTRISGQANVTCLRMTNWSNCVYLAQTASGTGARNGAGVNSHGNTASRTLLVPNSLVQLQPHNFYSATTIFAAGTNQAVNAPSVLRMGLQCAYSHPRAS